jgi:hypothetical protein
MAENTTMLSGISSFWVDFGWSKKREAKIIDNYVYLEIAEEGHCEICKSRIRSAYSGLFESSTRYLERYLLDRYPSDANTLWLGIAIPSELTTLEELSVHLTKAFGFEIHNTYC